MVATEDKLDSVIGKTKQSLGKYFQLNHRTRDELLLAIAESQREILQLLRQSEPEKIKEKENDGRDCCRACGGSDGSHDDDCIAYMHGEIPKLNNSQ